MRIVLVIYIPRIRMGGSMHFFPAVKSFSRDKLSLLFYINLIIYVNAIIHMLSIFMLLM